MGCSRAAVITACSNPGSELLPQLPTPVLCAITLSHVTALLIDNRTSIRAQFRPIGLQKEICAPAASLGPAGLTSNSPKAEKRTYEL